MDADDEVIGASFGITSITATELELIQAADLYFYAIVINPYDTTGKDTLTNWVTETLPFLNNEGSTITVGDATYTLYGSPGVMYWIDIQKAT